MSCRVRDAASPLPACWTAVALNVYGVELPFKATVIITLIVLARLTVFLLSALLVAEFSGLRSASAAGPNGAQVELPTARGCCSVCARLRGPAVRRLAFPADRATALVLAPREVAA